MLMSLALARNAIEAANAAQATRPAPDSVIVEAGGYARAGAGLTGPQARLMAERGAQVVAARNLLNKLHQLGADDRDPTRRALLDGVLAGHRYLPTEFIDGRTAVVRVQVELTADQIERLFEPPARLEETARAARRAASPETGVADRAAVMGSGSGR